MQQDLDEAREDLTIASEHQCDEYPFRCGCGQESDWWAPTMPQHAFLRDGLVHLTNPWSSSSALCGEEAVPYGVRLYSTDEARAYASMLGGLRLEVSCFHCIALDLQFAHGYEVAW